MSFAFFVVSGVHLKCDGSGAYLPTAVSRYLQDYKAAASAVVLLRWVIVYLCHRRWGTLLLVSINEASAVMATSAREASSLEEIFG